tara:strand:+ start:809 stop:1237 length:429 start_codon:yes stop_codon:yes gene_type:complete
MKLNVEPLEVVVFILFLLYLIMQVKTPEMLKPLINDPVGMVVIILGILYLLYYTHPILGILGIFVAYELMRRSAMKNVKHVSFAPTTERKKAKDMKKMNPPKYTTLEEKMVEKMVPMKKTQDYLVSSYKPVLQDTHSALPLK